MCSAPKKIKGYKELMIGIPKRKILVRMGAFFATFISIFLNWQSLMFCKGIEKF